MFKYFLLFTSNIKKINLIYFTCVIHLKRKKETCVLLFTDNNFFLYVSFYMIISWLIIVNFISAKTEKIVIAYNQHYTYSILNIIQNLYG